MALVSLSSKTDTSLGFTPEVVQAALGKPDSITTGRIPFLVSSDFGPVEGPVYWYGDTGFCFGSVGPTDGTRLYMLSAK